MMTRYAIIYENGTTDRLEAEDFRSVCKQLGNGVVAIVNDFKVMVHRENTPMERSLTLQAEMRVLSERLVNALAKSTVRHGAIEESLESLGELSRRLNEEG